MQDLKDKLCSNNEQVDTYRNQIKRIIDNHISQLEHLFLLNHLELEHGFADHLSLIQLK